jgi:hypothetical protein
MLICWCSYAGAHRRMNFTGKGRTTIMMISLASWSSRVYGWRQRVIRYLACLSEGERERERRRNQMRCGRDNGMIYFFRVNFIRKVTIEAEGKIESNQIKSNRRCVLFHRDSFFFVINAKATSPDLISSSQSIET